MIKAVIFDMYETLITLYGAPLYFGAQMAEDSGIPYDVFQSQWVATDAERTLGKLTLEEVLEQILRDNHCYSKALFDRMVEKRKKSREDCFTCLHPEIIPMLQGLKERRIKIGLISNCFSEEAPVIRKSELFPYFDVSCMSYEVGLRKPDPEIYKKCMRELGVKPENCLYVGDGGSSELEAADALGMHTVQAVWYFKEGTFQPCGRKEGYRHGETPMEIVEYAKSL